MKNFLAFIYIIFFLTGCGGGGSSASNNDITIMLDASDSLKVSKNVLKVSYLPNYGVVNGTFSILKNPEEGNVTLLDELTGRYSYITNTENDDSFIYKISDNNA
ncbi:MAG: hypothetical protein KJO45_03230, partial [Sulfurovum sp.]|nr:hypothetical protein [Sulfurovum sp.]